MMTDIYVPLRVLISTVEDGWVQVQFVYFPQVITTASSFEEAISLAKDAFTQWALTQ